MTIRRVLLLDCETTGLTPESDRCIEVAVALYDLEHAAVVASYASLIECDRNEAGAINRIPVALLKDVGGKPWAAVQSFVNRADAIVTHGADFDRQFVPAEVGGLPWICSLRHIEWPCQSRAGASLASIALSHGVGVVSAHRAACDVDILARLLTRVAELGHPLVPIFERAMRPRTKVAALVSYDDRDLAKTAGFQWDGPNKTWWRDMATEDVAALPFPTRVMR